MDCNGYFYGWLVGFIYTDMRLEPIYQKDITLKINIE